MAQGDTPITVVGNLVADPELRYTPSGSAVANFRVASTPRRYDSQSGQWVDGEALFLTCNVWRQAAENVANSLTKGDRVIVNGRLRQRSFETREGEKRTVFEVEVDEVGPSLKYATSQVTKTPRQGGNFGGNQGGGQGNPGGQQGNQGGFGGPQGQGGQGGRPGNQGGFGGRNAAADDDPWNSAPQSGFDGGDEPPF
ncbi:MAG: single-stranded DNA-binding protein [Corynebacterium sp.]|uniref:Single-stranded DNA-binding protein n=1 Tax=Candidatus Corynebacterium faecigallinarum TaxID=2838528 RepID=A0A9D2QGZ8_9CORY|nr:single-stranded DNA-binding protein [Corynebacterium sp.]HJC85882.1 single-stranded DNA-binding protein [Candidatus Corynebacterium faecigallinarum]MDN6282423.1 single-stranded DNA-binding protein [Corynebacterium sp.]MDN6305356.1 single-stranded DNA-binding protein [Corynebacterium sp.]MDN6323821.1 single-stranded DNA-binding protein [Corynebacterium sp.]MDN6354306.1 single-stranded DNA-binding protein [Corynebacterium sp.]